VSFRALALDFDGVISDSAPEAFVVALRTYVELHPESGLCERAKRLSDGAAPPPDAVLGDELYAGFLELMPLGNRAEDYAVILSALDGGATYRTRRPTTDFATDRTPPAFAPSTSASTGCGASSSAAIRTAGVP
jgi:hypothetical protein